MTAKFLLRIAAVLMLIHLIGHSIGHSGWRKDTDPAKQDVIRLMTGPKFPFMGVERSMGDYFDGYGYIASVNMLLIILLLWICSNHIAARDRLVLQTARTLGILLVITSLLEFIFFFPFAAGTTLLTGLIVIGAGLKKKQTQS
jgi:hypothetical protein